MFEFVRLTPGRDGRDPDSAGREEDFVFSELLRDCIDGRASSFPPTARRTLKKNPNVEPSPSFELTPMSPPCSVHTEND
jgi:hypothetical protein